jgi:thioredoxin reductase
MSPNPKGASCSDRQLSWLSAWHQRRELASRAVEQALLMGAEIAFIRSAADLDAHSGDLLLTLGDGSLARSDTVVIATA